MDDNYELGRVKQELENMKQELERARRALRIIRQVSHNVLTGKTTVTDAPVFDDLHGIYHWRTLWGLMWSQSLDGLGENIPTPPPWPADDGKNVSERGDYPW